jgi:hypothetical protein
MPDDPQSFTHAQLVEAMLKARGINEGFWMLTVTFGFGASNVGENNDGLNPASFVPIMGFGIRKVATKEDNLTVDASTISAKTSA